MSKKLLYPLTGLSAMTLRRCAREEASPVALCAADELIALDRDAAVERMARALAFDYHGRDLWNDKAFGGTGPLINQDYYRRTARITFNALLEVDA